MNYLNFKKVTGQNILTTIHTCANNDGFSYKVLI